MHTQSGNKNYRCTQAVLARKRKEKDFITFRFDFMEF